MYFVSRLNCQELFDDRSLSWERFLKVPIRVFYVCLGHVAQPSCPTAYTGHKPSINNLVLDDTRGAWTLNTMSKLISSLPLSWLRASARIPGISRDKHKVVLVQLQDNYPLPCSFDIWSCFFLIVYCILSISPKFWLFIKQREKEHFFQSNNYLLMNIVLNRYCFNHFNLLNFQHKNALYSVHD